LIRSGAGVAVLGGGGLLGRAIVDELVAREFMPIVVDRGYTRASSELPPPARHVPADRSDLDAYRTTLRA
jgi:nucleoside-diphosphate-sugar epimerase